MLRELLKGAAAGFTATGPMTALMEAGIHLLPRKEQYPLPPREITTKVTRQVGLRPHVSERQQFGLAALAHFSYGAAVGALYGRLACRKACAGATTGGIYGLGVWAGSYLGLLPALKILKPATEHPPRRSALMIVSHLVWGAVTGSILRAFQAPSRLRK